MYRSSLGAFSQDFSDGVVSWSVRTVSGGAVPWSVGTISDGVRYVSDSVRSVSDGVRTVSDSVRSVSNGVRSVSDGVRSVRGFGSVFCPVDPPVSCLLYIVSCCIVYVLWRPLY